MWDTQNLGSCLFWHRKSLSAECAKCSRSQVTLRAEAKRIKLLSHFPDLKGIWELQWPSQELSWSISVIAGPYKAQDLSLSCPLAVLLKADDSPMHALFSMFSLEQLVRLLPRYPVFPVLKDPMSVLFFLTRLVDAMMTCRHSQKQPPSLSSPS